MRSGLTTENEKQTIRHSGMDCRNPGSKDESGDIRVDWIPALHAGMTQSEALVEWSKSLKPLFQGAGL
jgi:hypothetical protein